MSSLFFRRTAASKAEYHESARATVVAAQAEAAALGHAAVYAEHFLLGALTADGPGRRVLVEHFGVAPDDVRAAVAAARPAGKVPRGGPTFDPSTRTVLDRAAESATALGEAEVTSAHVVAGVLAAGGVAAELLRERGVDASRFNRALMDPARDALSRAEGRSAASDAVSQAREGRSASDRPPARDSSPRARGTHHVLTLTGSAEDWRLQLDAEAERGWVLVAVVPLGAEVRAVFRRD